MDDHIFTKKEFEALTPKERGFVVYWCGENPKQPNIPNEKNQYPVGSREYKQWDEGAFEAMLAAQDSEE